MDDKKEPTDSEILEQLWTQEQDVECIVGTAGASAPGTPPIALFVANYEKFEGQDDIDYALKEAFESKQIKLSINGRKFRIETSGSRVAIAFSAGETVVHKQPNLAVDFEAVNGGGDEFVKQMLRNAGLWMLWLASKKMLYQIIVEADGKVAAKKGGVMTEALRGMIGGGWGKLP